MDSGTENCRELGDIKQGHSGSWHLKEVWPVMTVDGIPGSRNSRCKGLRWEGEEALGHKHHCHNESWHWHRPQCIHTQFCFKYTSSFNLASWQEKTLMLGKTEGRRTGDGRGWDGWMESLTQWTWVWANSRRQEGQGNLVCCSPWDHKQLDTTEQLNDKGDGSLDPMTFT